MNDDAKHLGLGQVRRILGRLRAPDILRLAALARTWAMGLRQHDADDLLNEALDRILSGRRPWPSEIPMPAFLSQVMRSIADQWRREEHREPSLGESAYMGEEQSDNPRGTYETQHLIARMRDALAQDPAARGVLDHILADSDREEAQAALGMDATRYDTARRRMIRHLFDRFYAGWTE